VCRPVDFVLAGVVFLLIGQQLPEVLRGPGAADEIGPSRFDLPPGQAWLRRTRRSGVPELRVAVG